MLTSGFSDELRWRESLEKIGRPALLIDGFDVNNEFLECLQMLRKKGWLAGVNRMLLLPEDRLGSRLAILTVP